MAMRYEDATKLYQKTLKEISYNEKSWTDFLKSACKNYRLPFADMVLIYAQRPNATAVLEMEDWNKRYGLWIRTGSKGIAVFDSEYEGNARLKYYFDIFDTRETKNTRSVPIWSMREEYESEVINALADRFDSQKDETSLVEAIISATNNIVEDNINDYLKDLNYIKADSFLDGLDEQNTVFIYQNVLTSSIAYATLSRCGINADDYISEDSLRLVTQFNTVGSLNALGVPTQDMSQMIIGEIRKTVLLIIREENKNRTFATKDSSRYNKDTKIPAETERNYEEHEDRIHENGRISDSQSHTETRGNDGIWKVRENEKAIPQGTPTNTIHESVDNSNFESASDGDRPDSQPEERTDDKTDDGADERERDIEGIQSDGVDSSDEQHRRNDTRIDQTGTNLQLNENEVGKLHEIPTFFTLDEYEELIKYDKFRSHKNKDIQTVFQFYDDREHRLAYVKESFTKTIIETLYQGERLGYYPYEDKNALRVWKGSYLDPEHETYVSWEDVTSFIEDMIERNIYLSIPLKPIPTTNEQQLNIFDMEPIESSQIKKEKLPFAMPQQIVDTILAEGTEEKDSKMKIAVFFSLDRPIEENAKFLIDLYRDGSNGFILNQRNISYKWNADGMQIAWGKGIVSSFEKQQLSWEDISRGIRNLLDAGRYMSQENLDQCNDFEYRQAASTLWYMCQDMDYDETERMSELREQRNHGYPDDIEKITELLKTKEFYDRTIAELETFNIEYQTNPDVMRNGWIRYAPNRVIPIMERLAVPHLKFEAVDYHEPEHIYFITQDTIDQTVSHEHSRNQKYDTYSFFLNHQVKNERIQFLKKVWGEGGSSHYDSSAKGLKIKTGSYNNPYSEIFMKWKDVADRVNYLIVNNKFLTAHEAATKYQYEQQHIIHDIRLFFYHLPYHNIRPYQADINWYDDNNDLTILIADRDNLPHVLDLMQMALNNTDETASYYGDMKERLAHVQEYYYGTYTLFNEQKEAVVTTPYEPVLDIKQSLATALITFMEEYDFYELRDHYEESEFESAVSDTGAMLLDIAGVEDLLRFLNEAIFEESDPQITAKANILREELSMYHAQQRGSDLTQGQEVSSSYGIYVSQEEPRYNTGDFVFIRVDGQNIYGSIELIDDESVTIQIFPHDLKDGMIDKDIEISKEDFEKGILHDERNNYLYDQNRPLYRVEQEEEGLQFLSDEDRNTLGYQNYVLIKKIAPLIINKEARSMTFTNTKEDYTVRITQLADTLTIQEEAVEDFMEYKFAFDSFEETLNIREITEDGETEIVELVDDEPDDYEIELQLNGFANDYIKSIADRDYRLQSIDMKLNELDTKIVYAADGNISEFSGDPKEFDVFMDQYANEPINTISSLVPIQHEGKENVHLVEKTNSAHENFNLLKQIAPLIITGESDYMRFVAGEHMMPLSIEVVDENRIAISHYYELNGDMMADPDMEFVLNAEKEILCARTFQQDNFNYYRSVDINGDEVLDVDLEMELNEFTNQWFHNIINGYQLEKVRVYPDNYSVNVEYGSDGLISTFDGTDDELKWFTETYGDDPQSRISTLVADFYEEKQILPAQKENSMDTHESLNNEKQSKAGSPSNTNIATHRLLPDISSSERHNFHINDFNLGVGGAKEKYRANVTAINLLKQLDQEQRLATPDEQDILSHYVGWGSLSDAFDETKENWSKEYHELKGLLNDTEYKAARVSTLTAFYTPPIVIEAIYQKLVDMGLKEGNLLEPSCGVGNFIGMQPKEMDCSFYGVELDELSGKIAQQLYQKATIAIQGFEKTEVPDNLFDAVIGNVPYGQIPVFDPRYNQQKFMIHDYFFAKALDKVKVGGVVIFLTSKFTMDKQNRNVRKYIAQRADLLGAIRLPDDTFTANAGTRVTSDILILQKRERPLECEPEWIDIADDANGIQMNSYFVEHPEMILGTIVEESSQYGTSIVCKSTEGAELKEQLAQAMRNVQTEIITDQALFVDEEDKSIPADPTVRNFSYCIYDGDIYYRENSRMYPYKTSKTSENRIRGMIQIRDSMRKLIDLQSDDCPMEIIQKEQEHLHSLYDTFTIKYNLLNNRANKLAFQDDSSYSLISSLEVLNEDRTFKRKADIFHKRTIRPRKEAVSVNTANEALVVSMAEKGHIDFDFMNKVSNISKENLITGLQGVIFPNPQRLDEYGQPFYETADEYLSGDVREKLVFAKHAALKEPLFYERNVTALEQIQPERIKAGDISVRLGTTWIPSEYYKEFMYELLDTPNWYKRDISILYVSSTQEWNITRKSLDQGVKATKTYGTKRVSGYKIIENTLNLRDVKVFDKDINDEGKEIRVLNKKETAIAQDKQDIVKSKFVEWIWKDPIRRDHLCDIYNEKFNSIRNRTYDGSNLSFIGMNPDITLRKHQVDAIARILYGGNTLLAHCVGAGKSFEMIAAGMENKRLGFCNKPIYVVPNNIIGDFASDFYRLYPSANILVATTDTLAKANRHKFFSRVATGDWDGIIITHSQFIKMPVSAERQHAIIDKQVEEISNNIQMLKDGDGERFTIKQLEKMKTKLETKLEKLNDSSKKDDILCFEQLGIDMLFVDEADLFKNLFLYSKMRNVSGISQTDSQRASDLFMKTQYLDELTNYRGVVFATGTAISNSMAELYTMQRYLQYNVLQKYNLESFDAWASSFGETVTAMELAVEGSGFKLKTRFSKFFNLPELMTMFREVADIQTADMLDLPVPKVKFDIASVPASEEQKMMIKSLAERAEKVRNRQVKPYEDNMLKITSDGRKAALEQRLINSLLPENEESKVNACIDSVYKLWEESADIKGTQLIFCDQSTPTKDSKYIMNMKESEDGYLPENYPEFTNVYDEIKRKLVEKGIPTEEISFIHDANTDVQRKNLFAKVRTGKVRVLLGSTTKMGAGTNVQDRIVALHDLDCPWRPRDLEQRFGRGVRQGNINPLVIVCRYVTEGTFDAYSYQMIEKKQQFISQILTGKTPQRVMEEIDEAVLNYAEIKAIACGDPKIMERCNLEMEVNKLNVLKASYQNQKFELQDSILKIFPKIINVNEEMIRCVEADIKIRDAHPLPDGESFINMKLDDVLYTDKAEAGNMLIELCKRNTTSQPATIGEYRSFQMAVSFSSLTSEYLLSLDRNWHYSIIVGTDKLGNLTRINNALNSMERLLEESQQELSSVRSQLETAKTEVNKPFEREEELQEKTKQLAKLTIELKLDEKDPTIIDEGEVDLSTDSNTKSRLRGCER